MISIYVQKRTKVCRKKKRAARRSILRYIPIDTLADFYYFLFSFCRKKRKDNKYMLALADFHNFLFNFCREKKRQLGDQR